MAQRPVNPKHRRIYIMMRIKQIQVELAELKAAFTTKLPQSKAPSDDTSIRQHREVIFARLRHQELRKELSALKAEAAKKPKAADIGDLSDL
jgi:hypothetical protein